MIEAIQLLFSPTRTWEKITRANRGIAASLFLYLLPLMLITTGAESYAMVNWGYQRGQFDQVVVATREQAIRYGLTQFALELAIVLVGAKVIQVIALTPDRRQNYTRCFTAVAYGLSPLFLSHLLNCIPALNTWICWTIGITLSASALYMAIPLVLQPDQTKAFGIFLFSILMLVVLSAFSHWVVVSRLAGGFSF